MNRRLLLFAWLICTSLVPSALAAEAPARRRERAQQFHLRAQERTGVLLPLYVYPADVHTNAVYNRVIELKRRYETVPFWVIVNPASGPGDEVDANYTKAIDRLEGAGCVTLAYVSTSYAKRPADEVQAEIDRWLEFYPRVQGVFFDEMVYEDDEEAVEHQTGLNRYAREVGCWPTVANPGCETPGRYFAADAADVIVVHEGNDWPEEARMKGDYFGGYSDYPPFTRAVLVHSLAKFDHERLAMVRKYARWVYVTEDPYRPGDAKADNPWDRLSAHLENTCQALTAR